MKNIQPVGNNVLIEQVEKEEKTASGIIIPDSAKEKPQEGKVIAIAPNASDEISVGDVVIYTGFSHTTIKNGDTEYLIVTDSDIVAKYVDVEEI